MWINSKSRFSENPVLASDRICKVSSCPSQLWWDLSGPEGIWGQWISPQIRCIMHFCFACCLGIKLFSIRLAKYNSWEEQQCGLMLLGLLVHQSESVCGRHFIAAWHSTTEERTIYNLHYSRLWHPTPHLAFEAGRPPSSSC